MKTLLKTLVGAFLLAGLLGSSAAAQTRVATINLQKVFDEYHQTKRAAQALQVIAAEMDKSHKELRENGQKMTEEYKKLLDASKDPAVSAEERDKRNKAVDEKIRSIRGLEEEINRFERQATANLGARKDTFRKRILEEIKTVINAKAKSGGYTLVIDSGAQTYVADPTGHYYTPSVLYNSGDADLTDAVLKELNAAAPIDLPMDDPKTTAKPQEKPATSPSPFAPRN